MSNTAEILIVEESLNQAEQLKRILEQHNHQVSVEHNGELALASMRQRKPKIVISAIQMPEMDGYELCRKIKADEDLKDVPVILLTSLSDAKDIIRGLECGADNFIKPYDEELLLSRIEYILLNREFRVSAETQKGLEIVFGGENYSITPERQQMVDLLISTYETAVHKNHELLRVRDELRILNERLEDEVQERTTGLGEQMTGRAAAEEALSASEERYRRLVENSPETIAVHCEGLVVYVNPAGVNLLGAVSSAEIIGKPIMDLVHPDHQETILSRVLQSEQGEQTPFLEQKLVRLDGQVIEGEVTGTPTTYQDKPAVQIIIRDITERKRAEEALRASEERYRIVTETATEAIITIDESSTILFINPATEKIFGYPAEDMLGEQLTMLMPEYLRHVHRAGLNRYVGTGRKHISWEGVELPGLHKGGQEIPLEVSFSEVIKNGHHYFTGIARDITERKRAEETLSASEERYHRFFDENLVGAYISTPEGNLLACNPAFAHIFCFASVEEATNSSLDLLYSDPTARAAFVEALREKRKLEYYEVELLRCDGRIAHVTESVVGMFDEQGTLVEIKGFVLDSTERKLAEQALVESEERLRQSQKMEAVGMLAGGVAHDFNNLLTVILGNTQLAMRNLQPGDPLQLRLVEVEEAGNSAAVLTRQLLAFSRRQILERRTLNVNDTIGEIMKLLQRIIGEDVEVRVKYAPDLATVFADPAQIEQVIMNLGVNARDAMSQGGRLTIETSNVECDEIYHRQYPYVLPGRYVQISLTDSGTGMDEETQARIFDPFFTTKEVGKGTGLGLSMVYGIVKQHDGHINVYSEVGHGTTFKVFLPVAEIAVEEETQAVQPSLLGGNETILVAEDEEALRNLARTVLEGLGYTVLLAQNGKEAVEMFEEDRARIDMLLFDVVMPQLGGVEAYQQIRERAGDVPLLLMTGYSSETVQSRFVKQNKFIQDLDPVVIQKPYSVDGLGRKVREVLDQARQT
ncbi:MAG: PAS domain S-box protein [Pyrinomonadaceae bacterium]